MTIKPMADRVVIKLVEAEEKTQAGIILTGSAKEKPQFAEVVAVGPGGKVDGNAVSMYVKVGDKVITSKYSGTEVKLDGEEYTIVKQGDILAIVELSLQYGGQIYGKRNSLRRRRQKSFTKRCRSTCGYR